MKRTVFAAAAAIAIASAAPSAQAAERWQFDPAHTQVLFTVNHLGFTTLTGQFRVVEGELLLDRQNLASSSVTAVLKAGSVDMNHDGLNKHLKDDDFFAAEQFPELRFVSTGAEAAGDDRLTLTGTLTMLGNSLPVTLDVVVNQLGNHPMSGKPYAGFTATGALQRSQWGMDYLAGPVGDEIGIRINVEAKPASE